MRNLKNYQSIKTKWEKLQAEDKKIRIRDAAKKLETSEASLLSTEINDGVYFLNISDYNTFLTEVLSLDKIMLLIRSDSVVHEKTISSKDIQLRDNKVFNNKSNELILEFNPTLFKYIFSQNKLHAKRSLRSFQIFDIYGDAILKIYLKGKNEIEFDNIVERYKSEYNYELQEPINHKNLEPKSIIELNSSVKECECYDYDLNENILRKVLIGSSKEQIPIQIHAIGKGTIQYHKDLIKKIVDFGPWINIIDKTFNLHAMENHLKHVILKKHQRNNDSFYYLDFYDISNNYVLGICSLEKFNKDFNNMVDKINRTTNLRI
ncbi:MAG: hypothetical protein CMF91_05005 [Candidatus Marinimicrobia bacterium]|nr:hypothetical protein [Candidatus Neomarinimicrobiota bacterium]